MRRSLRAAAVLSGAAMLLAGCGGGSTPGSPSPTTPTPTPTPLPPLAPFQFQGITHVSWQPEQYVGAAGSAARRELAATGASWAGLLVTWYMPDSNSSQIVPDGRRTPTTAALRASIRHLKELGLSVMLKPHVDSNDGVWRGAVRPPDVDGWFASYRAFLVAMAQLAQEEEVELLCVGTELVQLSHAAHRSRWELVIRSVRDVYDGPLTYAANANAPGDELTSVAFWDLVDLGGLDVYVPLTDSLTPSREQLVQAWSHNLNGHDMRGAYRNWQASIGRPAIFTEIGYRSADGTNRAPWEWNSSLSYDPGEQADLYAAAFQVWTAERAWMRGVFWWSWDVPVPGPTDTGYTPRGKPALDVLATQYAQRDYTLRRN